jgi:acyl CoA:acetate/3-ketoacid CoA transferase beta subunit
VLVETAPGVTVGEVVAKTAAKVRVADEFIEEVPS